MAFKWGTQQKKIPATKRAIPDDFLHLIADRKRATSADTLLKDLIHVWGGSRQLALDLHEEYRQAHTGGPVRQRILEMIQRLIINNTDRDIGQAKPPSKLSTEELQAAAAAFFERFVNAPGSAEGRALAPEESELPPAAAEDAEET